MSSKQDLDLNSTEEKVVKVLKRAKGPVHLKVLAKAFANVRRKKGRKQKGLTPEQRNSWARNGLRRLVRVHLVKQVDRGTYEFVGTRGKAKKKAVAKKAATKPAETRPAETKQPEVQATAAAE